MDAEQEEHNSAAYGGILFTNLGGEQFTPHASQTSAHCVPEAAAKGDTEDVPVARKCNGRDLGSVPPLRKEGQGQGLGEDFVKGKI